MLAKERSFAYAVRSFRHFLSCIPCAGQIRLLSRLCDGKRAHGILTPSGSKDPTSLRRLISSSRGVALFERH
jgi:hypothetical protein